jgi:hypothetical protein
LECHGVLKKSYVVPRKILSPQRRKDRKGNQLKQAVAWRPLRLCGKFKVDHLPGTVIMACIADIRIVYPESD